MRTHSKSCRAALGAAITFPLLAGSLHAQGKLTPPGRGGDGIFEFTAPAEPMSAEGHAGPAPGAATVIFADLPVACAIRAVQQDGAGRTTARVLRGDDIVNLALGRTLGTSIERNLRLALRIGDDAPATVSLIVIDAQRASAPVTVATGQWTDPVQDRTRKRGLLKLQFHAAGSLRGGSVQLVGHSTGAGAGRAIAASGNGQLESSHAGFSETLLITSITLRAGAGVSAPR